MVDNGARFSGKRRSSLSQKTCHGACQSGLPQWDCNLCELICTSQQMLLDHLLGKKHAKRAAKAANEAAGADAPNNGNKVSGTSAMKGGVKRHSPLEVNVGSEENSLKGGCIHMEDKPKPAAAELVTAEPRAIIVDGLNWLGSFWKFHSARKNPWRDLETMEKRVAQFVAAARTSGFALVAVFDAATKTAKAQATWRLRRNRELCQEHRRVVLGIDGFFSDFLERAGVRVIRPIEADADDVIAALAAASGGCVLSKDSDFFRYTPPVRVCNDWKIVPGGLRLTPATAGSKSRASPRKTDLSLAELSEGGESCKFSPRSLWGGEVWQGTSSSADKRMGNLHGIVRPLRAAVYARLGERSAVERWPEWDAKSGTVVWERRELEADASLDGILDNPTKVVAWIEQRDGAASEERWRQIERAFNRCAIAAELCAAASRGTKRPLDIQRSLARRKSSLSQVERACKSSTLYATLVKDRCKD